MIRLIVAVLAGLSLLICLAVPVLYFLGHIGAASYRDLLLIASLGWFVFAIAWQATAKKGSARPEN